MKSKKCCWLYGYCETKKAGNIFQFKSVLK